MTGESKARLAFLAAQKEFPAIHKDAKNPHFKSKYATLAALQDAVLPVLHINGFWLSYGTEGHNPVKVSATVGHAETGWARTASVEMTPAKHDPQGQRSCVTYGRRGALECVLGLVADDDDGNEASKPGPKKKEATAAEILRPLGELITAYGGWDAVKADFKESQGFTPNPRRKEDFIIIEAMVRARAQEQG